MRRLPAKPLEAAGSHERKGLGGPRALFRVSAGER